MLRRHPLLSVVLFIGVASVVHVPAQSQAELSPAVNVHCSNTILRVYNTSPEDAKLISDEELEALNNELSEVCRPVQGWTTRDQLYRALAMTGVLSERLLRSMNSDTQHLQQWTEEVKEIKSLRSENQLLSERLLQTMNSDAQAMEEATEGMKALRIENQRLRDQVKKCGAH
jgi:hypothetical protein